MTDRVKIIEKETAYQGFFRIDRYTLEHRAFGGGWIGPMRRELFERGHAVAVLPYDPVRDEVVLIEQFRIGAFGAGWEPWMLEVVAGIVGPDESEEDVAHRETEEETGLTLNRTEPIARYLSSPGGTTEWTSLYCGEVDASGAGGVHGLADEHEDIKVHRFAAADALAMPGNGHMANATGLIALQWLALNRDRLRDIWK